MGRLDFKVGRFNTTSETVEIDNALRGYQESTGDEIDYYRFDRADSTMGDIYDEGSEVGRVFRGPFKVPVLHATHEEGSSESNDTGFYFNDSLHVEAGFNMLQRVGLAEIDLRTAGYLKDRIVYDDKVFRVVRMEVLGQIQRKDIIVSIDATQVKPDELVDDLQFRRWGSTPDATPYIPPSPGPVNPYNPPNPAGPQWFFGLSNPTTSNPDPNTISLYDIYLNTSTGVPFKRGTTGWVMEPGNLRGPDILPFVFTAQGNIVPVIGRGIVPMPFPGSITGVVASLVVPGTTSTILDIKKNGVSIYTTTANRPTFASGITEVDAELPDVITFMRLDNFSIDILQAGAGAADLALTLLVDPT